MSLTEQGFCQLGKIIAKNNCPQNVVTDDDGQELDYHEIELHCVTICFTMLDGEVQMVGIKEFPENN